MSGGRAARDKGSRFERAVVKLLNALGIAAERVPLSGSAGGSFSGDIKAELFGKPFVIEAKARGAGFKQLYDWLEGRDALVLRADRKEALVVLKMSEAERIVRQYEEATERLLRWESSSPSMEE